MDPRQRANELLARARARGSFVVTPDDAISPMDVTNTVQIPRIILGTPADAESTMVLPAVTSPEAEQQTGPRIPEQGRNVVTPPEPRHPEQSVPQPGKPGHPV